MQPFLDWQIATVKALRPETHRVKTLTLSLPDWRPHQAGQHYDIRLMAEDGYRAERSYSVASEPERVGEIDLTVEKIEDGEVSPYLYDALAPGDQIEVRGPIGGYFVWKAGGPAPLLLVAGGSGVVPLMSMLRHRALAATKGPAQLLYSSRTAGDIIFRDELERLQSDRTGLKVFHTLTRTQPAGWTGYSRRIDQNMLSEVASPLGQAAQVFICGPTLLVEVAADGLVRLGISPSRIRTERFGPTGVAQGG